MSAAPDRPRATVSLVLPDGCAHPFLWVPEEDFTAPPATPTLDGAELGLAYVFAGPRRVAFWTLGFTAPVDQVFVAPTGRVTQVFEARPPDDATLRGPASDVVLVLELAAHRARTLGLLPGAILSTPAGSEPAIFDPAADPGFIAIVMSDRAGWFLACELRARGYRIAHVHNTVHHAEVDEDEFDLELVYEDPDGVLPRLRELGPCLVLAGSELGVNAADYLAEALDLPGNGTLHSVARRDKAGMVDALAAARIPVMRQLRTRSARRILRWMQRRALGEVVIKPVHSAGTDRVTIARSASDVRAAVRAIVGARNRLGLPEHEVVAQERLVGPELYLNSVSRAGRHVVTEIWRETKRSAPAGPPGTPPAPFAYDTFELCPGDDVLAGYLTRWLERVLDALGVTWGPAHTELILTDEGPRLIDFGARLDGVLLPSLNEECIGRSPVQLTADAYLDAPAFLAFAAEPYRLRAHALMVVVDNPAAGVLRDDTTLRELHARLPTFHALRPRWGIGEVVPATRDAFSYHAIVTLRDPDPDAVRRDYRTIRQLESARLLLDVTPAPPDTAPQPATTPSPPPDPRATDAWGEALEAFGWTTVRDEESGLVGRRSAELDGVLLWVPRQERPLELAALERLRLETDARRVVVELQPGAIILPLVGAPLQLSAWDSEIAATLDAYGLTPTMHAQAPDHLELLAASAFGTSHEDSPEPELTPLDATPLADLERVFTEVGAAAVARWPVALAASWAGHGLPGALAVLRDADDGIAAAALGLLHDGAAHVPIALGYRPADLTRLAVALARAWQVDLVAPGTGISRLPGGTRLPLPPALRWRRPRWATYLADLELVRDAVGGPPAPSPHHAPELVRRFAAREHPLATWGGAAIGQALGRMPLWSRTAMLFREVAGDAPHAALPHARTIDLASLAALARAHELLWVGWEPPPDGGEVIAHDGTLHRLDWRDPPLTLHRAAALGLFPVRARWTHRKTFVLDLAGSEDEVMHRLEPRRRTALRAALHAAAEDPSAHPRVTITPAAELRAADWRRLEAIDDAFLEHTQTSAEHADDLDRTAAPHPRRAARALALGLGPEVVCATCEDDAGLTSYILCLLHDRVAWTLLGTTHPRARDQSPQLLLRWALIRHARARGCDLMDLYGAWDERHPDEHPSWRGFSRHKELLHACPVYYPPTLALFPGHRS